MAEEKIRLSEEENAQIVIRQVTKRNHADFSTLLQEKGFIGSGNGKKIIFGAYLDGTPAVLNDVRKEYENILTNQNDAYDSIRKSLNKNESVTAGIRTITKERSKEKYRYGNRYRNELKK